MSCCSAHGAIPINFSYDDVRCLGTETSLNACPHVNTNDCGSGEGLWITCATGGTGAGLIKQQLNTILYSMNISPRVIYLAEYRTESLTWI